VGQAVLTAEPQLQEFYSTLEYGSYVGSSPVTKAINTLKKLSKEVNFRKMERLEDSFKEPGENYVAELDETDREILEDVDPELIAEIVKLSMTFASKFPVGRESNNKTMGRIKNMSEVFKVAKHALVRPDFNHKLVNKRLRMKRDVKEPSEDILVYYEDATSSMKESRGIVVCKAIHLILAKEKRIVHYWRYYGNKQHLIVLHPNTDAKLKWLNQTKEYHKSDSDYRSLFKQIAEHYKKGDIIFATDGEDKVPPRVTSDCTFHCINFKRNQAMEALVKRSGGRYLIV
jgi:hypothetical protein